MKSFRLACRAALSAVAVAAVLAQELPEGEGKAVIQAACGSCHGVAVVIAQPRSRDEWTEVVSRMIGSGAQLTDEEYVAVIDYLAANFGPSS